MKKKILIIQTAFTGDAILASALLEKLHASLPSAELHLLVRKGNDSLFSSHPFLGKLLVWDKKRNKYKGLIDLLFALRKEKYDEVINLQRFASTGFLTAFSGAKETTGFDKNPFSFLFTHKIPHLLQIGKHETDRNQQLTSRLTGNEKAKPRLYPSPSDYASIEHLIKTPFVTIAPGSVWFTKTLPESKWEELIRHILKKDPATTIYLLGSPDEKEKCERIKNSIKDNAVQVLAGSLSLLQSAALMSKASMNYTNDSAPMHLCSAMNAPVTAVYCSTIPGFGFGPLSDVARIIQTKQTLSCRPCGLHGFKKCPQGHFNCALSIEVTDLIA